MKTITFYSYKGGTGRSLALANAAVYLATLGFKVVALDFDLEAPGLHYKFSPNEDGSPLPVENGVVDYVNDFLASGQVLKSLNDFSVNASLPGLDPELVRLIPAGKVPSSDYWAKLSRIDWHRLFYTKGAVGVQIFMELKSRIQEELQPDFLLIDARTGITEMGGVATTLLADKLICLVLPTPENLHGARAVLRSLKRSRRESDGAELEILIAVSRLPQMRNWDAEQELADGILKTLNEPASDPLDTLSCQQVFVLHSETALQLRESLRVASGINPDDSILLRDYLRLFGNFVPKESIEPKVHDLIEKAWANLRTDADTAVKDMEQLAESFGHPETYRELLRFYQVRNVSGSLALKRAQRLWELTGDNNDATLWHSVVRSFEPQPRWRVDKQQWSPNLDFIRSVWRNAGERDAVFAIKLANAYEYENRQSLAADVLLEVIKSGEPTAAIVARCIGFLDDAKRTGESETVIQQLKAAFVGAPEFANAWAKHAIRSKVKSHFEELSKTPWAENIRPALRGVIYLNVGRTEEAVGVADAALRDLRERDFLTPEVEEVGRYFHLIERWENFDTVISDLYPTEFVRQIRERVGVRPRRKYAAEPRF